MDKENHVFSTRSCSNSKVAINFNENYNQSENLGPVTRLQLWNSKAG